MGYFGGGGSVNILGGWGWEGMSGSGWEWVGVGALFDNAQLIECLQVN